MTTLCMQDYCEPRPLTRDDKVRKYAERLGLSEPQILACIECARIACSWRDGELCADRIHDKMRVIRTRFGKRPDRDPPPSAA